jgi:hypothetical protein
MRKFSSEQRTLARNPVLSGCSIVSGDRFYLTMIEGYREVKSIWWTLS